MVFISLLKYLKSLRFITFKIQTNFLTKRIKGGIIGGRIEARKKEYSFQKPIKFL